VKILYSVRDSFSAVEQLRFFKKEHDCKTMGFYNSIKQLEVVDWLLDGLYLNSSPKESLFLTKKYKCKLPKVNANLFDLLLQDIEKYKPNLIISDLEPVSAFIAKILDIPYWKVSSLHIIDHAKLPKGLLNKKIFNNINYHLRALPKSDRTLIISPFADFYELELSQEAEWLCPHYDKNNEIQSENFTVIHQSRKNLQQSLSDYGLDVYDNCENLDFENCNWILTDGLNSNISKALYAGLGNIYSTYSPKDLETQINSFLIEYLDLGKSFSDWNKAPEKISDYLYHLEQLKIIKQSPSESSYYTLGETINNI